MNAFNISTSDICLSASRPRSFNDRINIPFYICAPDYRDSSGGIRVLHYLCHILNEMGEEAYLVNCRLASPRLRTPLLTLEKISDHFLAGLDPVTIYPEVVSNNPFNTPSVVRWLLNIPGRLNGRSIQFEEKDLIFYYEAWCIPSDLKGEPLFIHPVDHSHFNNDDPVHEEGRTHECYYANKYLMHGQPILGEHRNLTSLGQEIKRTHREIGDILRKSKVLYCYEPSGIISEAQACGCPVLFVRSDYWELSPGDTHHHIPGSAVYGEPNALERALQSLGKIPSVHAKARDNSWVMTRRLAEAVYSAHEDMKSNGKPLLNDLQQFWSLNSSDRAARMDEFTYFYLNSGIYFSDILQTAPLISIEFTRPQSYIRYLQAASPQEIDVQLLAERMVRQWPQQPQFHLLLDLQPGEEGRLADTLDSLAVQLYSEWMLTVVTTLPAPADFDEITRIQWLSLKSADDVAFVINELAVHSSCQWIVRVEPGLMFETHALLVVADQINYRPEWALIYTDEDTREPSGSHSLPCFKPGPDPFMLRNQSYPGSFVAVRKDAFMAAGQFGTQLGAEVYDLTLRVLDSSGAETLGHIDAMLVHLPRESTRSIHTVAEAAAVQAHLLRQQTDAFVRDGESFGVRTLTARTCSLPNISILIESHGAPDQALQTAQQFLTQTDYPAFEVLITDASANPLHLQLLHLGAEQHDSGKLRTVDTSAAAGKADRIRLMLIAARGTHVLFVAAESRATHPIWLKELALAAAWPGVGAVQAGLVNVGGGQMVCPPYTPALLFSPLGLAHETIHTLPTQQRMLAALDERALLVSKAVLAAFLGRTEGITHTYWALALARHLQDTGLHMLWKPEVQIRLLSSATQPPRFGMYGRPLSQAQPEEVTFIERQLEWLAGSHLYNGNLSYSKPCQFNLNRMTEWDVHQGDRPKLLVLGGEGLPLPAESLRNVTRLAQHALAQVSQWTLEPDAAPWVTLMEIARVKPTTVLFGHAVGVKQSTLWELMRQYLPKVHRVFCADDGADIAPRTANPEPQLVDLVCAVDDFLQLANRVVVTSTSLAEALSPYHPKVRQVMPWLDGDALMTAPVTRGGGCRIGLIHPENDPAVLALLADLLKAFKNEAIFVCFGEPPTTLSGHPGLVHIPSQQASFVTHEHLQAAKIDLVLLPRGEQFWPGLADNRLVLNAIAAGCSCLSSPMNGFSLSPLWQLGLDSSAWEKAIQKLLDSPEAQNAYADTLRHWVGQQFDTKLGQASAAAAYLG